MASRLTSVDKVIESEQGAVGPGDLHVLWCGGVKWILKMETAFRQIGKSQDFVNWVRASSPWNDFPQY